MSTLAPVLSEQRRQHETWQLARQRIASPARPPAPALAEPDAAIVWGAAHGFPVAEIALSLGITDADVVAVLNRAGWGALPEPRPPSRPLDRRLSR